MDLEPSREELAEGRGRQSEAAILAIQKLGYGKEPGVYFKSKGKPLEHLR